MLTVKEAWARIDEWLAKHEPDTAALLAPPADPAEIAEAEEQLGLKFPADLVESLLCHNGGDWKARPLPGGMPLLSVDGIVELWQDNVEIQEDLGDGGTTWWHRQWIPFAGIDSDSQYVDQNGAVGVHHHDAGGRLTGRPSLRAYLAEAAGALSAPQF